MHAKHHRRLPAAGNPGEKTHGARLCPVLQQLRGRRGFGGDHRFRPACQLNRSDFNLRQDRSAERVLERLIPVLGRNPILRRCQQCHDFIPSDESVVFVGQTATFGDDVEQLEHDPAPSLLGFGLARHIQQ